MHSPLYWTVVALITLALLALSLGITKILNSIRLKDGAVIVVTGGSRGLGFAIASRFARKLKVRLVLASRKMDELQAAKAKLIVMHQQLREEDIHLVAADLSVAADCQRLVAEVFARFGRIDVLVNNAGIIEVGPAEIQPSEAFERTMQINFFGAFYTTWAALPYLLKQVPQVGVRRAAIVNIASVGGKMAVPHMLPYTTAKFALVGFSQGLHSELHGKKIVVTTVCPGLMRTGGEAHAEFIGDIDAEKRWFNFAAKTPGIATTAEHAANKIFRAVERNRAEITITPQAWLAARFAGMCPETLQFLNAAANELILPKAPKN